MSHDRLLLHICCAPCSVMCVEGFRNEGIEPTGFWYNPNIHPFTEYRSRRNCLCEYAASIGLKLEMRDEYGLRQFCAAVSPDFDGRCRYCYETRLGETARYAAEHGYDAFSSTLFYSPYQDHPLMQEIGRKAGETFGVEFVYRDFRPVFRQGQERARELGLYMQKFCGCIFSEEERYHRRKKPKPAGEAPVNLDK